MYALNIDKETGRVLSVTFEKYAAEGMPLVDTIPEGDIYEYTYQNGKFTHNPLPKPEDVEMVTADDVLNALLGVTE